MTTQEIYELGGIIGALAAVPALLIVLVYGIGSPWWGSWLGRVIFVKWLSVFSVIGYILARRGFGEFPGYEWWSVGVYALFFVAMWATLVEILIERRPPTQHAKRKETAS